MRRLPQSVSQGSYLGLALIRLCMATVQMDVPAQERRGAGNEQHHEDDQGHRTASFS
jgi:hypothetical protein